MTHANGNENMIHEKTLQQITEALEAGLIYNVDWKLLKESINRQLSKGYKAVTSVPYLALPRDENTGERAGVPREVSLELYYAQGPQIHANMQNKIAKLERTFGNHWMVKAARDYADAVLPIIADANKIKATITKARKPREGARQTDERTIENTGTCAVCGMNVKRDKRGNIVDHGYRVSWHERQGGCYGVGYKPIELSPEGAEHYLTVIAAMLEHAEQVVASFTAKHDEDFLKWRMHELPEADRKSYYSAESTVRHAGRDVTRFEKIIAEWEATDLPDVK